MPELVALPSRAGTVPALRMFADPHFKLNGGRAFAVRRARRFISTDQQAGSLADHPWETTNANEDDCGSD